jgi:hypothetical protein
MDCELVRAYRKAYELKQEYDNSLLWLQGLYVYRAMEAQRPGWAFYGDRAPKPEKYMEKPIAITENLRKQYAAEQTQMLAEQFRAEFHRRNQSFDKQDGEENGGDQSADITDRSQVQGRGGIEEPPESEE